MRFFAIFDMVTKRSPKTERNGHAIFEIASTPTLQSDLPPTAEHVLVVDDDAAIRRIVHDVLDWEGCAVVTARDGREALQRIEGERPRVLLLDLWMPVLDGWALMHELRTRGLDIPVIVMTAGRDAQALAAEIGATGYLSKPFDLTDLLAALQPFIAFAPDPAM